MTLTAGGGGGGGGGEWGVGTELFGGKKSRPSATLSSTNLWAENLVANHPIHARAV